VEARINFKQQLFLEDSIKSLSHSPTLMLSNTKKFLIPVGIKALQCSTLS